LAVYDLLNADKSTSIYENTPYQKGPENMGPYAYSKIEAERLVFDAFKKYGLGVTIVRPGIVIGPRGRVFFPHLGYRYKDLVFLMIGRGDNLLPLTYVENTVDGIYKASISEKAIGQAYNFVDEGQVTVRDFLEKFMTISENKVRLVTLPYIIPYLASTAYEIGAGLGLLKKNITSRKQLKWKHKNVRYDCTKAKKELGWETIVPIEEGINRTFMWYQNRFMRNN
jgi:nucleoside-diphosphate-sugar epimerase